MCTTLQNSQPRKPVRLEPAELHHRHYPNPAEACIGPGGARGASRSGSGSMTTKGALFALKVHRKVSNAVAILGVAG
jgi:hypothetical protein